MLQDLFELVGRIRVDTSGLDSSLQQARSQVESVGKSFSNVGKKLSDVGGSMTKKVTMPIAAVGALAMKSAVSFESAFAGVKKTVDTNIEGFAKLEKGIREMAKSGPTSAIELAGIMEMGGQLGIAESSLLSFSSTISDLTVATNMSADQAATQFARFANIVGMSQSDFDKMGSSVVALGNNLATTESEIMSMTMRLAAQGSQVKMSEAEILGLSGAMSSVGIQSEMGGTAMTKVLKKMQGAIDEGGGSLGTWAEVAQMSSKEFKKLYDESAIGGLDAVIKGLNTMSSRGENLTDVLEDMGIKGVYESDVMLRMSGASHLLAEAVDLSTDAWEKNSALTKEAEERYKTTESQLQTIKNKLTDAAITIGNILIPVILSVIKVIEPWIEKFAGLSEGTHKFIIVIAALVAAIGPLLIFTGMIISSIGSIIGVFASVTGVVGKASVLFGRFLPLLVRFATLIPRLFNPVGLAITAFLLIWKQIFKAFDTTPGEVIAGLVKGFGKGLPYVWEAVKEIGRAVIDAFKQMLGIASPSTLFYQFGIWIIEGLINGVSAMVDTVVGIFRNLGTAVINVVQSWMTLVLQAFANARDAIIQVALTMQAGVVSIFTAIKDAVISIVMFLVQFVIDLFVTMYTRVIELITTMRTVAVKIITQMTTALLNLFRSIVQGAIRMGSQLVSAVRSAFSKAWEAAKGFVSKAFSLGADFARGIARGISSGAKFLKDAIVGIGKAALNKFTDFFKIQSPSRVMEDEAKWLPAGIAGGIVKGVGKVSSAMGVVGNVVKHGYKDAMEGLSTLSMPSMANILPTPRRVEFAGAPQEESRRRHGRESDGGTVNLHVRKVEDASTQAIQNKVERGFFRKARQRE